MVLLLHDERPTDRAVLLQGIAAVVGKPAARQFISPNDVRITYHGGYSKSGPKKKVSPSLP